MFKLMDEKIFAILRKLVLLNWPNVKKKQNHLPEQNFFNSWSVTQTLALYTHLYASFARNSCNVRFSRLADIEKIKLGKISTASTQNAVDFTTLVGSYTYVHANTHVRTT